MAAEPVTSGWSELLAVKRELGETLAPAEGRKSGGCPCVLDLQLPYSLVDAVRQHPAETSSYFVGKGLGEDSVSLIGHHLDANYFRLIITLTDSQDEPHQDGVIVCHIQDAEPCPKPTLTTTEFNAAISEPTSDNSSDVLVEQTSEDEQPAQCLRKTLETEATVPRRKTSLRKRKSEIANQESEKPASRKKVADKRGRVSNDECATEASPPKSAKRGKNRSKLHVWMEGNPSFVYCCRLCMHESRSRSTFRRHVRAVHGHSIEEYLQTLNLDPTDWSTVLSPTSHTGPRHEEATASNGGTISEEATTDNHDNIGIVSKAATASDEGAVSKESITDNEVSETSSCERLKSKVGASKTCCTSKRKKKEPVSHTCRLCLYTSPARGMFMRHVKHRHKMNIQSYITKFSVDPEDCSTPLAPGELCCSHCDFSTDSSPLLQEHRQGVHSVSEELQPLVRDSCSCKACPHQAHNLTKLREHLKKTHHDHPELDQMITDIKEHRLSSVTTGLLIDCPCCDKAYAGKRVLTHLKLMHKDEKHFKEIFENTKSYHMRKLNRQHKPRKNNTRVCPYCAQDIKCNYFKLHTERFCEKNSAKLYLCPLCGFQCHDNAEFKKHRKDVHIGMFVCETCAKSFTTSSALAHHARFKHGTQLRKPVKYHVCPVCQKQFESKSCLQRHLPTHQDYRDKLQVSCQLCKLQFRDKFGLREHVKMIHNNQYRYHCPDCGHGVKNTTKLQAHQCDRIRRKPSVASEALVPRGDRETRQRVGERGPVDHMTLVKTETEAMVEMEGGHVVEEGQVVVVQPTEHDPLYLVMDPDRKVMVNETEFLSLESGMAVQYI